MKILYFGGQKCGKTGAGSQKALQLANSEKPYYIATYDNSYSDSSMIERINKHISNREDNFYTIEEPKDLVKVVKPNKSYLIDCISMWIFNNLQKSEEELIKDIEELFKIDANIVFILNDVSCGVIPPNKESRKFVDLSGVIGQKLAELCSEVYEVKFGIKKRLK